METKTALQSSTIRNALLLFIPVIAMILQLTGVVEISKEEQNTFIEAVIVIVEAVWLVIGLIKVILGRIKARTEISGII
jgi:hypothetical protein